MIAPMYSLGAMIMHLAMGSYTSAIFCPLGQSDGLVTMNSDGARIVPLTMGSLTAPILPDGNSLGLVTVTTDLSSSVTS